MRPWLEQYVEDVVRLRATDLLTDDLGDGDVEAIDARLAAIRGAGAQYIAHGMAEVHRTFDECERDRVIGTVLAFFDAHPALWEELVMRLGASRDPETILNEVIRLLVELRTAES